MQLGDLVVFHGELAPRRIDDAVGRCGLCRRGGVQVASVESGRPFAGVLK
jgi:hypothetical protein